MYTESMESTEKFQDVYQQAQRIFSSATDWITYFRDVLGIEGIIRQAFPNPKDLAAFEQSKEFDEIQHLLARLRERQIPAGEEPEPTRVITVRLPKSMHEALRTEAHEYKTSMNKLCISKLLQIVDDELVPKEQSGTQKKEIASTPENGSANGAAKDAEQPWNRVESPTNS